MGFYILVFELLRRVFIKVDFELRRDIRLEIGNTIPLLKSPHSKSQSLQTINFLLFRNL